MGDRRDAYMVLMRRHEGRKPPGRPRSGLEDNIKMDLQERSGMGEGRHVLD
jgi:hypothetical protein